MLQQHILFLLLLLLPQCYCNNKTTLHTQINALKSLYDNYGGEEWKYCTEFENVTELSSKSHFNICNFSDCVDCTKNVVTSLNLATVGIVGKFPETFSVFSDLTSLILSENHIEGEVPEYLCSLKALRILSLGNNRLTTLIPPCMADILSFTELDMSSNPIFGPLPTSLCNIHFDVLVLDSGGFEGSIPPCFGNMGLIFLALGNNNISGSIPDELCLSTDLSVLGLENNSITGAIPSCFSAMTNLLVLSMEENQISGSLPDICAMRKLEVLTMGDNMILDVIPECIGNLTMLQSFSVTNNQLFGVIPDSFCKCTELVKVGLDDNLFTGELPGCIGNLVNLELFSGVDNLFNGSLPVSLCDIANLTVLTLGNNSFSGTIPDCIGNLAHLQLLGLPINFLSGSIPLSLCNLTNLTALELGLNLFEPQEFPECLGYLFGLQTLDLAFLPGLHGVIPPAIFMLPNLEYLFLSQRQSGFLYGELPQGNTSAGYLPSIKALALANCGLSGNLPSWLMEHNTLYYVLLDGNFLSGNIPPVRLGSPFESFGAAANRLEGNLDGFQRATKMTELDLSYNQIGGVLEDWLFHRNMSKLKLAYNRLSCEIPSDVSIFESSQSVLDVLSGNLFACPLPEEAILLDANGDSAKCGSSALWYSLYFASTSAIMSVTFITSSKIYAFVKNRKKKREEMELGRGNNETPPPAKKKPRKMPTLLYLYDFMIWVTGLNTACCVFILVPIFVTSLASVECRYGWIMTASDLLSHTRNGELHGWVLALFVVAILGGLIINGYLVWYGIKEGVVERIQETWKKREPLSEDDLKAQVENLLTRKRAPIQHYCEELPRTPSIILASLVVTFAIALPVGVNVGFIRLDESSSHVTSSSTKHSLIFVFAILHEAFDTFVSPSLIYLVLALLSPPRVAQNAETDRRRRMFAYRLVTTVELVNSLLAPVIALIIESPYCFHNKNSENSLQFDIDLANCKVAFDTNQTDVVYYSECARNIESTFLVSSQLPYEFDGAACLSSIIKLYTPAYIAIMALRIWWVTIHMALIHRGYSYEFFLAGTSTTTSAVTQIEGTCFGLNTIGIGLCAGMLSPIIALASWLVLVNRWLGWQSLIRYFGTPKLAKLPVFSPLPADCVGGVLLFQSVYGLLFLMATGFTYGGLGLFGFNIIVFLIANMLAHPDEAVVPKKKQEARDSKDPLTEKLIKDDDL
eukprot:m.59930 g.59930  ORF g.59930 m.59930 type:complete len:1201 (-) comp11281_c0_seq1:97-3699(-)